MYHGIETEDTFLLGRSRDSLILGVLLLCICVRANAIALIAILNLICGTYMGEIRWKILPDNFVRGLFIWFPVIKINVRCEVGFALEEREEWHLLLIWLPI